MYITGHAYLYFVQFGTFGNLTKHEQKTYFKIGVTINPKVRIERTGYISKSFKVILEGKAKYLREIESAIKKKYGHCVGKTREAYEKSKKQEIKKYILSLSKKYDNIIIH